MFEYRNQLTNDWGVERFNINSSVSCEPELEQFTKLTVFLSFSRGNCVLHARAWQSASGTRGSAVFAHVSPTLRNHYSRPKNQKLFAAENQNDQIRASLQKCRQNTLIRKVLPSNFYHVSTPSYKIIKMKKKNKEMWYPERLAPLFDRGSRRTERGSRVRYW